MVRALVTADLHLGANPRDIYRHQFMKTLTLMLEEQEVDLLLILGDLTEEKDNHGAWLVNKLVFYIARFARRCPVIILRGNHDYLDASVPFYGFLSRLDRVAWVNAPTNSEDLSEDISWPLGRSLFLPHTPNWKRDYPEWDVFNYEWVFAHNTFEGAKGDNNHLLHGIPTDIFPPKARVIAGDIHKPQKVGPVTYVGAPYLVDFGDNYKPRVLLLEDDKMTSIPCVGPQKRLVEISELDELDLQPGLNEGDILKVRVKLDRSEHAAWPAIQKEVRAWGSKHGYWIYTVQPELAKYTASKASQKGKPPPTRNDKQLVEEYASKRNVDPQTLKVGVELL